MKETQEFLKVMNKKNITIQTFADKPKVKHNVIRIFHGEFIKLIPELQKLNKRHAGIYYMVNNGDLQGRKKENVTDVTSYFVDLDGEPLRESYPLEPTAIIESSKGRYQIYWKINNAPLAEFTHIQDQLAKKLKADEKVKDLPRVMRLPGFYHMKREPQKVNTLYLMENSYQHEPFKEAFAIPKAKPVRTYREMPQAAIDFLAKKGKTNNYSGIGGNLNTIVSTPQGNRNNTLFSQACAIKNDIAKGLITEDEAYLGLYEAGLYIGLEDKEINRTIQSAWRYGELN